MTEISEDERQRRIEATKNNPWYKLALEGKEIWNLFIIKAYFELVQNAQSKYNIMNYELNPIITDLDFEHFKNETGITEAHIKKFPKFLDGYFLNNSHNFKGFIFPSVSFQNCIFDIDFHAEGAIFLNGLGFGNTEFRGDSRFTDCIFEEANFSSAKFLQDNFFENTRFYGRTEFCDSLFRSQLLFKNVTANDDIEFDRTILQIGIFDDCKFLKSARFRNTEFSNIRMRDTTITKNCSFFGAKFSGIAQFNKTNFEGFADFRKTEFSAQGNRVLNQINTDRIGFDEISPSFIGTDFKEGVDFQNALFNSPPHFEGAKCEIILLDNTTIKNPPKPDKDILHIYASAWAALIRLMEKVHNLPKRQEFHERLLEIERQYKTEKWSRPLYVLYELFGSGRSALKPVYWLFCLGAYFAFYYFQFYNRTFESAMKLSFANTLPFLTFSKEFLPESKETPIDFGLLTIMTTQNFVSIILLFMFGLALRNRFKLK